ncbi:MAG: Gfo/Idh/MocA family oxidoreductase [Gemmatimonadota bacterium]|nr:Gfo/Idh/MocA family oxidoreductase [Gemmatimonadota bacterium]
MSKTPDDRAGLSRRDLLKSAAFAGAALGASGALSPAIAESVTAGAHPELAPPRTPAAKTMKGVPFDRHETVRIAIVGTGLRGRSVLHDFLGCPGVKVTALCDNVAEKAQRAAKMVTDAGQPAPALYTDGDTAFEQLVQRDDIDFIHTATPWEWHVPVMLAALKAGKHVSSECPFGMTLKELWALVDASEKYRRHCLQLENCNYGYNEMLVNRMVHAGVFGEPLHGAAAYLHDLRGLLFEDRDEGLWRRRWHITNNANLYPTHGLGPVAWYLDIHKGDKFEFMVSMSTEERGLTAWREEHLKDRSNAKWQEKYVTGDLNSSLIKTAKGRTILLQHDVSNPRPYSRLNALQGTKGVFEDYPARIYIDGQAGGERFGPIDAWKKEFEHPLWTQLGAQARGSGHGGMDFIMAWRMVQCLREGLVPDIDVYDSAAWSAPFPLSEISVAKGSAPVKFPDFTRGNWKA